MGVGMEMSYYPYPLRILLLRLVFCVFVVMVFFFLRFLC